MGAWVMLIALSTLSRPVDAVVIARPLLRVVERLGECGMEGLGHKRGLAAARNACHAGEQAQMESGPSDFLRLFCRAPDMVSQSPFDRAPLAIG